jgi:hypothetical protein
MLCKLPRLDFTRDLPGAHAVFHRLCAQRCLLGAEQARGSFCQAEPKGLKPAAFRDASKGMVVFCSGKHAPAKVQAAGFRGLQKLRPRLWMRKSLRQG